MSAVSKGVSYTFNRCGQTNENCYLSFNGGISVYKQRFDFKGLTANERKQKASQLTGY